MSRAVQSPVWICFLDEDLNNTARLQKGPWPLWAVITSTISPDSTFIIGHLPYGHGICSCATGCPVRYGVIRTYERISSSTWKAGASLVSMANNVGWAFSPQISGWLQVNYGFNPAFAGTIILYVVSIFLYWRFFWYSDKRKKMQPFRPDPI